MRKFLNKIYDTAYGMKPFVLWLADFLLMGVSLFVIVTMPFYWQPLAMEYGEDFPSNVFALALCAFFGSLLGFLLLDESDYRRRY